MVPLFDKFSKRNAYVFLKKVLSWFGAQTKILTNQRRVFLKNIKPYMSKQCLIIEQLQESIDKQIVW